MPTTSGTALYCAYSRFQERSVSWLTKAIPILCRNPFFVILFPNSDQLPFPAICNSSCGAPPTSISTLKMVALPHSNYLRFSQSRPFLGASCALRCSPRLGRYVLLTERDKTITTHFESSTLPNWNEVDRKAFFNISEDELSTTNATASIGMGTAYLVWSVLSSQSIEEVQTRARLSLHSRTMGTAQNDLSEIFHRIILISHRNRRARIG